MMELVYQSLKELVTPEMATRIAEQIHAEEAEISRAVSATFAGFLFLTQINGDTLQIRNIFEEAGSLEIFSRIESVCSKPLTPEMWSVGNNFLQHVLGDRAAGFMDWVSSETGLPKITVNTLVVILAPVFVGYVGEKLVTHQWSMHKLLGLISIQRETYREFISGLVS